MIDQVQSQAKKECVSIDTYGNAIEMTYPWDLQEFCNRRRSWAAHLRPSGELPVHCGYERGIYICGAIFKAFCILFIRSCASVSGESSTSARVRVSCDMRPCVETSLDEKSCLPTGGNVVFRCSI